MQSVSGFYYLSLENVATSRSRKVFTQKRSNLKISKKKKKQNKYVGKARKVGGNKALAARSALSHNRIMKSASLSSRYINNTRQLKQKQQKEKEEEEEEEEKELEEQ